MKKNKGFALIVALIVTLTLSLLGVMSMQTAFFQQNITINNTGYNLTEQAADSMGQYLYDTVRLTGYGDSALIGDAESNYGYLCLTKTGHNKDEAICETQYMDESNVVKADAYMIQSSDDYCMIFGNTVQSIKCYNVLARGQLEGSTFETNTLSGFSIIEISTNSYGVYDL